VRADGRSNVLATMAHPNRPRLAVGIIDADHDHLDGAPCPEGVCRTETCDLESLILRCAVLDRVLHQLGSADKLNSWEEKHGRPMEQVLRLGLPLARFRRLNQQQRFGLCFKKRLPKDGFRRIDLGDFIDPKTLALDEAGMVKTVLNFSQRQDLKVPELLTALRALPEAADPWLWVNGHDLAALVGLGLKSAWGNKQLSGEEIEALLHLTIDREELLCTTLGASLRAWQELTGASLGL
jgi:hypothetical protein